MLYVCPKSSFSWTENKNGEKKSQKKFDYTFELNSLNFLDVFDVKLSVRKIMLEFTIANSQY